MTSTGTASDAESSSHALGLEPEGARFLVGLGWTRKSRKIGKEDGLSFDAVFSAITLGILSTNESQSLETNISSTTLYSMPRHIECH